MYVYRWIVAEQGRNWRHVREAIDLLYLFIIIIFFLILQLYSLNIIFFISNIFCEYKNRLKTFVSIQFKSKLYILQFFKYYCLLIHKYVRNILKIINTQYYSYIYLNFMWFIWKFKPIVYLQQFKKKWVSGHYSAVH